MRHHLSVLFLAIGRRLDPTAGTVTERQRNGLAEISIDVHGQHYVLGNIPTSDDLLDDWTDGHDCA